MEKFEPSLSERKENMFKSIVEECMSCGMSVGADGFTGDAAAEGPAAGYDPLMKTLKRIKKKRDKKK